MQKLSYVIETEEPRKQEFIPYFYKIMVFKAQFS